MTVRTGCWMDVFAMCLASSANADAKWISLGDTRRAWSGRGEKLGMGDRGCGRREMPTKLILVLNTSRNEWPGDDYDVQNAKRKEFGF